MPGAWVCVNFTVLTSGANTAPNSQREGIFVLVGLSFLALGAGAGCSVFCSTGFVVFCSIGSSIFCSAETPVYFLHFPVPACGRGCDIFYGV